MDYLRLKSLLSATTTEAISLEEIVSHDPEVYQNAERNLFAKTRIRHTC